MTSLRGHDPAKFADGSSVRIADTATLEEFLRSWTGHHKLEPQQLKFAGQIAKVERSLMYHGGDVIYQLQDMPGFWHETCLNAAP